MSRLHKESHLFERSGWLRAAVLGANDGIISTASLMLGVASAAASKSDELSGGEADQRHCHGNTLAWYGRAV
jgi:VIT1/CCC1 family predicted Fe2+/Mn2+ transporter